MHYYMNYIGLFLSVALANNMTRFLCNEIKDLLEYVHAVRTGTKAHDRYTTKAKTVNGTATASNPA